jgi:hypothetical protein
MSTSSTLAQQPSGKPNIVFILVDNTGRFQRVWRESPTPLAQYPVTAWLHAYAGAHFMSTKRDIRGTPGLRLGQAVLHFRVRSREDEEDI